ncbi:MAG: DUF1343 domain-containing protein [Myxococcota bacterium]
MRNGLDVLLDDPKRWLQGRVGLIANPTTVDRTLRHGADRLAAHPDVDLVTLFGPEHGIRSDAQYMEGVTDERDEATGLPVFSLYGDTFESLSPTEEQLAEVDALVFDIQDIGTRYYTYAATMALAMKAAKGRPVVVLDRPNPLGGVAVEGGGIDPGLESFVGLYPVPQRHGLTVGELARLYRDAFEISCDLRVVPCEGWRREQLFDETDLPWVLPSPNMPTLDTALVYPGMCLLEGTTVSEGRGTTRPFELFGAPYVRAADLAEELNGMGLPGLTARPAAFTPTFDKYTGELCRGVQLHVTDRSTFLPYRTGLAVLVAMKKLYPASFGWRTTAYEFRDDVLAIDLLTGRGSVREAIDQGHELDAVAAVASFGTETYSSRREAALLY